MFVDIKQFYMIVNKHVFYLNRLLKYPINLYLCIFYQ